MQAPDGDDRISQIQSVWSLINQASDEDEQAVLARRQLLSQYSGAVYRYLMAMLRNRDKADEVFQDFSLRFMNGAFRKADPEKGRFRDYLKTAIVRMAYGSRRKEATEAGKLAFQDMQDLQEKVDEQELDRQFDRSWREDLINRAWDALADFERETGQRYYTMLRWRVEHADVRSAEMAERLTVELALSQPLTAAGIRKTVQRAREKFADFLLADVQCSLGTPSRTELEEELIALDLYEYCKPALERRDW